MQVAGFSSPTPIQAQTWPISLQGRDIVAIAKTGSGKTLGYLIPAFIHLRQRHNSPQNGPTVLVLAPTRELATQIQEEVIKFGRASRISCTVCDIYYFLLLIPIAVFALHIKFTFLNFYPGSGWIPLPVFVWWSTKGPSAQGVRTWS